MTLFELREALAKFDASDDVKAVVVYASDGPFGLLVPGMEVRAPLGRVYLNDALQIVLEAR